MGFKKFLSVWFIGMISLSLVLAISGEFAGKQPLVSIIGDVTHHFSVRWMGFPPANSSQYPEYCICINNLTGWIWTMNIGLQLKNQEARGYYFQIGPNGTSPAGWTLPTVPLNFVGINQTYVFNYSATRSKIVYLSQGELVEQISLVIKAFNDTQLTQFYSQDSFNITYRFLDYRTTGWSTPSNNTLDPSLRNHSYPAPGWDSQGYGWSDLP